MSDYAWIITYDHFARRNGETRDAVGITGPGGAPRGLLDELDAGKGDVFKLYDDDGELYYTGRLVALDPDDEVACFAPLDDFGAADSGCTLIRWPRHPHRDNG